MHLPIINVNTLGKIRTEITLDGEQPFVIDSWDGALPHQLFFFIVDRGVTTRDEIFEAFWPELSVKEATNVYHVTKTKILGLLGLPAAFTAYVTQTRQYCLQTYDHPEVLRSQSAGHLLQSDGFVLEADFLRFADEYLWLTQFAKTSPDWNETQMNRLSEAIGLYQGPYLPMFQMPWIQERRRVLAKQASDLWLLSAKLSPTYYHQWQRAKRAVEIAPEVRDEVVRLALEAAYLAEEIHAAASFFQVVQKRMLPGQLFTEATLQAARKLGVNI